MVITISHGQIHLLRAIVSACSMIAIVLPSPVSATDWKFVPTLRLRESYSDNVDLAPPPLAKAAFISEVAPGVSIIGTGPRLNLNLAYSLQKIINTHQGDTLNHQLHAAANAKLLDDWLFVDASSNISRYNVSAFGPQAIDDILQTDNQSTVQTNRISPFLSHRFKGIANTELRYLYQTVSTGNDLLSVKTDEFLLNASGDNGGHGWNWDARYDEKRIDDHDLVPVRISNVFFSLHYPVSSKLNAFATTGYEKQGYTTTEQAQGSFWSVGMGWYPSSRNSVVVSGGRRFFGNTYALDASHRSRKATWVLNYNEDITTTQAQFGRLSGNDSATLLDQLWSVSIPDRQQRQQFVHDFIRFSQLLGPDSGAINYFSHRYFLQKQMNLSMASASQKSAMVLGISATERTAQTSNTIDIPLLVPFDLALEDKTRQMGANAGWNWRMAARTSASFGVSYSHIHSMSTGRKDGNLAFSVGLSRTLQPGVTASVDLRRVRHTSTQGGDFRENGISATLNFQL